MFIKIYIKKYLLLLCITTFFFTPVYAEDSHPENQISIQTLEKTPEFTLGSLFAAIKTEKLGSNQRTEVYSLSRNNPHEAFFYIPALLPEWDEYQKLVDAHCTAPLSEFELSGAILKYKQVRDFEKVVSKLEQTLISEADPIHSDPDSFQDQIQTIYNDLEAIDGFQMLNPDSRTQIVTRLNSWTVSEVGVVPELKSLNIPVSSEAQKLGDTFNTLPKQPSTQIESNDINQIVSLPIRIALDDVTYREDLINNINRILVHRKASYTITDDNLYVIPYDLVRIILNIGEYSQIIHETSDLSIISLGSNTFSRSKSFALDGEIETKISAPCATHRQIASESLSGNRNLLTGELYRQGAVYAKTSLHFLQTESFSSELGANLFTDENTTLKATSSGSSYGASLNIPMIGGIGGGNNSSASEFVGKRLISREVIQKAVANAINTTSIQCDGGNKDCATLIATVVSQLFSSEVYGRLFFIRINDQNRYKIISEQLNYATILDSDMSSNLDQQFRNLTNENHTGEEAISVGGTEGFSVNEKFSNALKTEIENKTNSQLSANEVPVAVSGNVAILSLEDIESVIQLIITQRIPIKDSQRFYFNFIYPALSYKDGKVTSIKEDLAKVAEAKKLEELKKRCIGNRFLVRDTLATSRRFRGHSPSGWTPSLYATARKGYYIPALVKGERGWRVINNGSHGKRTAQIALVPHEVDKPIAGKPQMYQSVGYRFKCSRGNNPINRRNCTAAGSISYDQQPLQCEPFLIK